MLTRLCFLLRNLVRRRAADQDLAVELEVFHAERPAPGSGPEQWREQVRAARAGAGLESWARDLRLAVRALRHAPGLTAACVLTFALGIGANAVVFSMANAFLFRPLPVPHPGQLQTLRVILPPNVNPRAGAPAAGDLSVLAQTGRSVFSSVGMGAAQQFGLSVNGSAHSLFGAYVTPGFLGMMGIAPVRGRFFSGPRAAEVVLSYDAWLALYQGSPAVIGRPAQLNGRAVTIVGVAPRGFHGVSSLFDLQLYVPWAMANPAPAQGGTIVRLRAGVAPLQATPALAAFTRHMAREHPATDSGLRLELAPLGMGIIASGGSSDPIPAVSALFLVLAALVLMLAAANVMGLLLARAAVRAREMAVRSALGAGRGRLARQALLETGVLAAAGAGAGLLLGALGSRAVSALPPNFGFPIVLDFRFDWRVCLYAAGLAVLVALVAGAVPAWRAAAADPNDALRSGHRGAGAPRQRLRSALVAAQVAGSLTLLIAGGLFVRSLRRAEQAPLGFQPAGVWNFTLDVSGAGYNDAKGAQFYAQLLPRISALPGVAAAALAQDIPMGLDTFGDGFERPGSSRVISANFNAIAGDYFAALQLPLLAGRGFTPADAQGAPPVAIINRALARQLWPHQNAIGQSLVWVRDHPRPIRVVGICADALFDTKIAHQPGMYVPLAQAYIAQQTLQVRIRDAGAVAAVSTAIRQTDANVPFTVQSMDQVIAGLNGLYFYRLGAQLAMALGLLGLLLALVGVYGVVANTAAQRTHEMGVRLALGAAPRQLVAAVVRGAVPMLAAGIVIGLLLAAALGKLVGAFLVGVSGLDPLTFITATILLTAVAGAAALLPARRALRADPLESLRCE